MINDDGLATPTSAAGRRGRGRPRHPTIDQTVLRATLELLRLGGRDALTIDAIALRSGSAKSTIYRRWPSLENVIVDALRYAVRERPDQDAEVREFDARSGSPVHGAARQMLSVVSEPMFESSFPMMARILLGESALGDRFRAEVFAPLRAIRREELLQMVADGLLRPGLDPDLLLDMANGALLYRALMAGPLDEGVADEVADIITRAFAPDPTPSPVK